MPRGFDELWGLAIPVLRAAGDLAAARDDVRPEVLAGATGLTGDEVNDALEFLLEQGWVTGVIVLDEPAPGLAEIGLTAKGWEAYRRTATMLIR